MDPVTHFTSGIIVSGSFNIDKSFKATAAFGMMALAPDIDNIAALGSHENYLIFHRGFTHSIWGGILLGLICALMLKKFLFREKFSYIFMVTTAIMYIHIYFDYVTSYGTQLLAPLNRIRFSLSSVFIIDPFYTFMLIVLSFICLKKRHSFIALIPLLFLIIYPLSNEFIKIYIKNNIVANSGNDVEVTTTALTPLYWKAVIDSEDKYLTKDFFVTEKIFEENLTPHNKMSEMQIKQFSRNNFFRTYLWFIDYPVIINKGKNSFEIYDLKFTMNSSLFRTQDRKAFSLKLKTDSNGYIKSYKFN